MTTTELRARGFAEHTRIPRAFTWCSLCCCYRWFTWWIAPLGTEHVAACETCGSLPVNEAQAAQRYPVQVHDDDQVLVRR